MSDATVTAISARRCTGCSAWIPPSGYLGTGYCAECIPAVNRLVARGVYFSDHCAKGEWGRLVVAEREAAER